jgi:hypothetical protein
MLLRFEVSLQSGTPNSKPAKARVLTKRRATGMRKKQRSKIRPRENGGSGDMI